jgi:hypothetical protein
MVNAPGVQRRSATEDAMHLIPFSQQQFRQVRTVLTGDAGEEGFFFSQYATR